MSTNLIRLGPPGDLQELSMFGRVYDDRWIDGLFREDRAASTKMRRDVLGFKKGFLLTYELADQIPVDRFDVLFQYIGELTLEVTHLTEVKTYQVLLSPFTKTRILAVWGGLWGGIALDLVEV